MPDHTIHHDFKKAVFGTDDMTVDQIMDRPVRVLGKKHRVLFHDPLSVLLMFQTPQQRAEAALHILVDHAFSNPRLMTPEMKILASLPRTMDPRLIPLIYTLIKRSNAFAPPRRR